MQRGFRWNWHLILASACVALIFVPARVEAQFRYRYGLGYGYGGFNYHSSQVDYLNQRALLNASHATMGSVPRNGYANDPNAYYNHIHDLGYLDRYKIGERREIEARIGRFSDGPAPSRLVRRDRGAAKVQVDREEVPPDPVDPTAKSPAVGIASSVRPSSQFLPASGLLPLTDRGRVAAKE